MFRFAPLQMFATFLVAVLLHCCSSLAEAQPQSGCSSLPTSTQVETLIAQNYAGGGQSMNLPTVTLQTSPFGYRVVCSASSGFRNQYRFVSIVANFTTSGPYAVNPPGEGVLIYGQFEFECVTTGAVTDWSATSSLLDTTSKDRTILSAGSAAITANITTNCAYCLKQSVSSTERVSDDTNHCSDCIGCSQPLCYTPDRVIPTSGTIGKTCCNFYSSDDGVTCTTTCDPPYFPDANRTCTLCNILNCQNGGTLRSDMCGCNCTALVRVKMEASAMETLAPVHLGTREHGVRLLVPPAVQLVITLKNCNCTAVVPVPPRSSIECGAGCIVGAIIGVIVIVVILAALIAVGVYLSVKDKIKDKNAQRIKPDGEMTVKDNDLYIPPDVAVEVADK
eukprot:Em0005g1400a